MSIESYAVMNFLMNIIIMATVARSRGRIRWGNVAFAAAFGALYALAMNTRVFALLRAAPAVALLTLALSLIAVPCADAPSLLVNTACLIGGAALFGGVMTLTLRLLGRNPLSFALGAGMGAALLSGALSARGRRLDRFEARVRIRYRACDVRVDALVDTGNCLREPVSGRPVLILSEELALPFLPPGFDPRRPRSTLPPGFRLVGYTALGGGGCMGCFRPDALLTSFGRGWMRAPDVWVAVYPGSLPTGAQALAPPVLGRIDPAFQKTQIEGGRNRWSISRVRWFGKRSLG